MKNNYIGCSGFIYPEWKGKFYPSDLPRTRWLVHYSSKFNTVELNGTFYKFPVVKNLNVFYENTPPGFKFSIKANKVITHSKKMKNVKEQVDEFMKIAADGLKEKLGCVLFQLPPSFRFSDENLQSVLNSVPLNPSSVIEFRNPSWWNESVYEAFKNVGITFCNTDYPGMPETIITGNEIFYMRFHGKPILYKSEYSVTQLKLFSRHIPSKTDSYIYFNNTWGLAAITNALSIREILEK